MMIQDGFHKRYTPESVAANFSYVILGENQYIPEQIFHQTSLKQLQQHILLLLTSSKLNRIVMYPILAYKTP